MHHAEREQEKQDAAAESDHSMDVHRGCMVGCDGCGDRAARLFGLAAWSLLRFPSRRLLSRPRG